MNFPNAFGFLVWGAAMLWVRSEWTGGAALTPGRSAWLLVMGAVLCLIAAGFFARRTADLLAAWMLPRWRAWQMVQAESARPAVRGGARVSV